MDPRRDYPNFTDAALAYFIRRFPSHPDHAAAVAEVERRRKDGNHRNEPERENGVPSGRGFLIWAIAGIVILVLTILFLLLPISTARIDREPRPIVFLESSSLAHKSSPSAKGFTSGARSPKPSATDTPVPQSALELTP